MQYKWRVSRSETGLKGRWIDVRADDCVTRTGVEIQPYYMFGYPDWVHVAAITDADELVLVPQYRLAEKGIFLELPGRADVALGERKSLPCSPRH